jgi:CheY-like chemotaxis protein
MTCPTTRPSGPIVLLVEDSEDDAFFFRWTLRKCGVPCEIMQAIDGAEAVRMLEEAFKSGTAPDLVFLDLKLPNMNGFEVLTWIRSQGYESRLDVSVLSGSDQAADLERARSLGAARYYVKPLSVEQLQERLEDWRERQPFAAAPGTTERITP